MKTAHDIVETVGRERIKDAFKVKDRVIAHHLQHGTLPAIWYDALCKMAGQDLPRTLFTFKGAA